MPYKHQNGCTCMTMPEFLSAEGKIEGKTGDEVWTDIIDEMNEDCRKTEQEYLSNPAWLLEDFKKECDLYRESGEIIPIPIKIVKVKSAKVSQSFKVSRFEVDMEVLCENNKIKSVMWWREDWSGSFYEPPESDGNIIFS